MTGPRGRNFRQAVGDEYRLRVRCRMLPPVLNRAEAIERVSACEAEIRALGVSRLALFGYGVSSRERRLVDRNSASWNRVVLWMRQLETLSGTA